MVEQNVKRPRVPLKAEGRGAESTLWAVAGLEPYSVTPCNRKAKRSEGKFRPIVYSKVQTKIIITSGLRSIEGSTDFGLHQWYIA